MRDFVRFLLGKVYQGDRIDLPGELIEAARDQVVADVQYHHQMPAEEVLGRVTGNQNELAVFLYRLGRRVFESMPGERRWRDALHWLLRECCGCEIYFSSRIGVGFYVVHGLGTVIGSRHTIGQGFQIYQGCTIGHLRDFQGGCTIGDDVIMYQKAAILGEVSIGDKVVIGPNCQVRRDVPAGSTCLAPDHQLLTPRD